MKKLLSLSFLICFAFLTLTAQSNSQKNKGEERADPKLVQELRSSCRDLLRKVPNPNDPKLTFPSSKKTQLNKLRSALNEGSRLSGNSKMKRVERVLEDISAAMTTDADNAGKGVSSFQKKKPAGDSGSDQLDKCIKTRDNCLASCSLLCYQCNLDFIKCTKSIRNSIWMKVFEGKVKEHQAPTTPPATKG